MHGNPYIKGLICECAWSVVSKRDSYLSKFYWRIKQKRGAKKAVIALSRKILTIAYHILNNGDVFDEKKFELVRQKQEILRLKKIESEIKKYGLTLVPMETHLMNR